MKQLLIILLFCGVSLSGLAQETDRNPETGWDQEAFTDIHQLGLMKYQYERCRVLVGGNPNSSSAWVKSTLEKQEAYYERYVSRARKIKADPDRYLAFLNTAIEHKLIPDPTTYGKWMRIRFLPGMMLGGSGIDPAEYRLLMIDYFRLVRYSLFEKGDDLLPEDFRPVMEMLNQRQ